MFQDGQESLEGLMSSIMCLFYMREYEIMPFGFGVVAMGAARGTVEGAVGITNLSVNRHCLVYK